MKVCIATTTFPRWAGDTRGTFIWEAARALAGLGVQIRVIAMHHPGAKTHEWLDDIEVIRPRYAWPERLEILQKEGGGLPIMWQRNPLTRFLVWQFLAFHTVMIGRYANECDLVHANWTLSAAAAIASRAYHRCPIVATIHGSDMVQATRLPFVRSVTKEVLRRCDQVIAVSRFLAKIAHDLGVPASSIVVIPDGVDTQRFTPGVSEREALIIYVGSLIKIKGVEYLLQSIPFILREYPDIKLAVIGEGPEKVDLLLTSRSLGISSQVEFLGALPPAQIQEWMRRARVLVLPSIEEGLGVVLLEAMSSGTPCIASNTGGIPDIVTPDVGQIIPPANPQAIASAVNSILADRERWLRLSRNARVEAETHYSWPIIAQRLIHVYRQTVTGQS